MLITATVFAFAAAPALLIVQERAVPQANERVGHFVRQAMARLKAGEPAAAILRADSLAGFVLGSIKTEGERDGGDFHQLVFEELREGDIRVLGPDQQGDYIIFQKLVHDPGHQLPFEQVQAVVDESVQNLKADSLLKEFLARHRARHDVELHPERLMRIHLTDPSNE